MFLASFKIVGLAVGQIILLAGIGYFLVKKDVLGHEALDSLSRLTVEVTLPILIFCQLLKDFNFSLYANWWIFPLISLAITILGLLLGGLLMGLVSGEQHKIQFLNLVAFQNSGFLPLALIASLLPEYKKVVIFIYLFLFLVGFNLALFSLSVHLLAFQKDKRFALGSLLSAPVTVTLFTLGIIFFGCTKFIPQALLSPLRMVGDCTLPLAMFVVGGNLAQINLGKVDKKAVSLLLLAKLIILPALGLWFVLVFKLPELIGLLIVMQLAMPSATTLSVIVRQYKKEDLLVSQGIFFSHIVSIITIPIFLSFYFALSVIK